MNAPVLSALSVRERIMRQLKSDCEDMQPPEYTQRWSLVTREPLDEIDSVMGTSLGIYDSSGNQRYEVGRILDEIRVIFEFWYKRQAGDVASVELNRLLADLKKLLLSNPSLQESETGVDLIERYTLLSDEFDIDGPADGFVSGILAFSVRYRHDSSSPFALR